MTGTDQLSWFALRVAAQREDMVKKFLIYKGYQAFTKLERRYGRWVKGKRIDKEYVAAPSYVFLGTTRSPWEVVHNCHLIRSVVSYNGRPAQLQAAGLADFLGFDDFSAPESMRWFRREHEAFSVGDMVRVETPTFDGFVVPVKDIRRGEVIFDLVMMGVETEVRVRLSDCHKAA